MYHFGTGVPSGFVKIDSMPQAPPLPLPVKLLPQNRWALKRDHPSGVQSQISAGRRVSHSPRGLLSQGEFPEPADQNIVAGLQRFFDQLENLVDQGLGLVFGKADLIVEGLNEVFFYEGLEGLPGGGGWVGYISWSPAGGKGDYRDPGAVILLAKIGPT
jgi:hypothetical protein